MPRETGLDQPNGSIETETGLDQPNGSTQTETGSAQNVLPKHIVLHVAALRGNFETAEKYGDDLKEPISRNRETALHVATLAGQKEFVKKLVEKFGPSIREIQNGMGKDALSYAATMGSLEMVKVIVEAGNFSCLSLESRKKAFLMAAGLGHRDITKYLFELTELQVLKHEEMRRLYIYCVEMGLYAPDQEVAALSVLARTPSAFSDESQSSGLFNRFARLCE
ncbi:hypothetical protein FEM48_Zijuj07G0002100 [Ziziphus jujuba var. spinosa]|uniref:Uncharacterized protein n=1 Tax=Ziziphus jujuba var. spinosa TaxID=714518 RepID=A0A978V1B1_ZIZJJ|nr:hypothetical protein FEM48_Zijuj07G0002100 [Ziziphus jujuba var. spinosa]